MPNSILMGIKSVVWGLSCSLLWQCDPQPSLWAWQCNTRDGSVWKDGVIVEASRPRRVLAAQWLPVLLAVSSFQPPSLSKPLLFQHIPKAGGSTLRDTLYQYCLTHHIETQSVIPCYRSLKCTTNEADLVLPHMLNKTACAVVFGGHWSTGALGLLAVLVQVDLGVYGPVACRRWPWLSEVSPQLKMLPRAPYNEFNETVRGGRPQRLWLNSMGLYLSKIRAPVLKLLSNHTTCVIVLRSVEERMISHYNHFSYESRGLMQDFAAQYGIPATIAASGGGVQLGMSSAGTMKLDLAEQVIDHCKVVGTSTNYHHVLHALYDEIGPDIPCVQTANELPHLNAAEGQHVGSNESSIYKGAPALVAQWTNALAQDEHLVQEHALFDYVRGHSSLPLEGSCPPKSA